MRINELAVFLQTVSYELDALVLHLDWIPRLEACEGVPHVRSRIAAGACRRAYRYFLAVALRGSKVRTASNVAISSQLL